MKRLTAFVVAATFALAACDGTGDDSTDTVNSPTVDETNTSEPAATGDAGTATGVGTTEPGATGTPAPPPQ